MTLCLECSGENGKVEILDPEGCLTAEPRGASKYALSGTNPGGGSGQDVRSSTVCYGACDAHSGEVIQHLRSWRPIWLGTQRSPESIRGYAGLSA
jgi:hypothetical protein